MTIPMTKKNQSNYWSSLPGLKPTNFSRVELISGTIGYVKMSAISPKGPAFWSLEWSLEECAAPKRPPMTIPMTKEKPKVTIGVPSRV